MTERTDASKEVKFHAYSYAKEYNLVVIHALGFDPIIDENDDFSKTLVEFD